MSTSKVASDMKQFKADALTVRVFPNQNALATDAAADAAGHLRAAIARQGSAAAILASAASQVTFLDALVSQPGIDWSRVTLFHMDEYLGIDAQHPASFRRFLRERVERRVQLKGFHFITGEAEQPLDEVDRYAGLLAVQPIDLCCLGIGENGHIAFNDPPVAAFDDPRPMKLVKLDEACRRQQVGEGAFPNLAAVPQFAYTLTIPTLCAAKKMICVVPEKRKAVAVRDTLRGLISTACPASILRRQTHCSLYLDGDSAGLL